MKKLLIQGAFAALLAGGLFVSCQKETMSTTIDAITENETVTSRDSSTCDSLGHHHHHLPSDSTGHPPFDTTGHGGHHPIDTTGGGHPPMDTTGHGGHHPIDTTGGGHPPIDTTGGGHGGHGGGHGGHGGGHGGGRH